MILALTSVSPSSMIANTNVKNVKTQLLVCDINMLNQDLFHSHTLSLSLSLLFSSLRVYLIVNCSTDAMS
ncbi:hypothetical protein HBH46_166830 [Parastagonospora nodorum]|nr:hypothetical protein HBH46_166830 [Parastagonospora nodorum]KAH5107833.1 hypothetical protein HBH72_042150 [Parastagonospora nodorum]KAH5387678.1 hypothetical protein HBI33_055690 [Parastagonospora nodorum]KAH5433893.1 hypothetical protein HBI47_086730 [Parastagonospora nodorum]KAH5701967.1 hypothetical protein HBI44_032710 [Parastagonospora nodorum]